MLRPHAMCSDVLFNLKDNVERCPTIQFSTLQKIFWWDFGPKAHFFKVTKIVAILPSRPHMGGTLSHSSLRTGLGLLTWLQFQPNNPKPTPEDWDLVRICRYRTFCHISCSNLYQCNPSTNQSHPILWKQSVSNPWTNSIVILTSTFIAYNSNKHDPHHHQSDPHRAHCPSRIRISLKKLQKAKFHNITELPHQHNWGKTPSNRKEPDITFDLSCFYWLPSEESQQIFFQCNR